MGGYAGKYLEVDLTRGVISEFSVGEEVLRKYLGGSGLAAYLFFRRGGYRCDPLGPDNDLYVLTGPISGTLVPGSSRFAVAARSPLTGIWGEGSCGGNFAPALKRCGFDGLVFTGQSPAPVMLVLDGGTVELRGAEGYWGLDNYEIVPLTERYLHLRSPQPWKSRVPMVLLIVGIFVSWVLLFFLMFWYFKSKH